MKKIILLSMLALSPACLLAEEATEDVPAAKEVETAEKKPQRKSPFVSEERVNSILNTISDTTRDTKFNERKSYDATKMALDLRLPQVLENCDIKVSHEILLLSYAYVAKMPGSRDQLKSVADGILRKKSEVFKGVSTQCRGALRSFSLAIMRVDLGEDWSEKDDEKLQESIKEDDTSWLPWSKK